MYTVYIGTKKKSFAGYCNAFSLRTAISPNNVKKIQKSEGHTHIFINRILL
jgi:hypothetical protein